MSQGLELLDHLIREHPSLKVEDHSIVNTLCTNLALQEDHGLINKYICNQPDNEAMALYLLGKYESWFNVLKASVLEHRAGSALSLGSKDQEGFKWTKQSKEEWLLATDATYIGKVDRLRIAENLYSLIKGLYGITLNRDEKLQHLSNNYRRELRGNER